MPHSILDREEYVEQAYFFRVYRERLEDNMPSQEVLAGVMEEILATTRLPMALDFLRGEMELKGRISDGMSLLDHYFTAFQSFVMERAEEDRSKFDQRTALLILEREASYRSESPDPAGLFIYQFECISRNRLGYDNGMRAMTADPMYDENWKDWINKVRLRLGATEFSDLIYYKSEYYKEERRKRDPDAKLDHHVTLFGINEGRIAKANTGKDPLFMFAALQRHLGYPEIPKPKRKPVGPIIHPMLEQRLQQLELRLKLLEVESKDNFDISKFSAQLPKDFDINPKFPGDEA